MMADSLIVPFVDLAAQYQEIKVDFLRQLDDLGASGQYILGEQLFQFEKELASFCESKHVIAVANGSDALFLILKALGIGPGDEVITAPNSFVASAWVIAATGATPRYCEVDEGYNLDPKQLSKTITKRTKAIIPVHLAGIPCKIEEVVNVAREYQIEVIEDCAQAIGARFRNKHVGNFGTAGGFSLHPLKNLGVLGDGGFLTTNDSNLDAEIRLLRNHGLVDRDHVKIWGYNSRLDEIQALIGRLKLRHLNSWNERVREIASNYQEALSRIVETLKVPRDSLPVWHNFLVFTEKRDSLRNHLLTRGIDTRIHYPIPIHLQEVHGNEYVRGSFPKAEYQSTNSLSLPIYPTLTDHQVEVVTTAVKDFFE